jgi:hypothetical protein
MLYSAVVPGVRRFAMKFGVAILVIVALAGCSREGVPGIPTAPASPSADPAPPAPPAPPTGSALLWVMVIGESGACIEGATIQIVRAEGAGEPIPQRTPCGAWDYDGGLVLTDLTPGVELKLRGAANGYARAEMSFLPFPIPGSYQAVFITLSKAQ